jgi:hypothetical protein
MSQNKIAPRRIPISKRRDGGIFCINPYPEGFLN